MYDIIGDIHGHADELLQLLKKLGYDNSKGYYWHPERKAVFVGDFIDRGPKIRETLKIVKGMVDNESALATMGNHEYNALCYHTLGPDGIHLRKHTNYSTLQVKATLDQFAMFEKEWRDYMNWFRKLPVYLDLGELRVVHACWDPENVKEIPEDLEFTDEFLNELHTDEHYKKSPLYKAIDECLKGREVRIPNGYSFKDKYGKERYEMRVKWYRDTGKVRYRDYYMEDIPDLSGDKVDQNYLEKKYFYGADEKPVFCGHYWFSGTPEIEEKNVACVDYSIGKEEKLVAYRWDGEKELSNKKFVWISGNGNKN